MMHCRALLPHQLHLPLPPHPPPPPRPSYTPQIPLSLFPPLLPHPLFYARQTTVEDPQCMQCKQRIHLICAEQWFCKPFSRLRQDWQKNTTQHCYFQTLIFPETNTNQYHGSFTSTTCRPS